jgi:hypothetical protein
VTADIRSVKNKILVQSEALYLKLPADQQENLASQLGWSHMNDGGHTLSF